MMKVYAGSSKGGSGTGAGGPQSPLADNTQYGDMSILMDRRRTRRTRPVNRNLSIYRGGQRTVGR